ncbi:MAG: AraC family transcriptional regulator of adaptative response / DNA-3-methyladenine glycosylase II [Hyphomicrobiaceae bacterium]|jgi:AraC family transcriptional regulator of adaptative response / DNA-3-methyladenine glycosylase II
MSEFRQPLSCHAAMVARMSLDQDSCWNALEARDPRFDGRFFTGVHSTGIYCRPVCPARTPARRNVEFFRCAAAAEDAGLRPCKRCRPETAPGSSAWLGSSATVKRALRLIDSGALETSTCENLADSLGVGERQLRRLFLRELGTTPTNIEKTRRLHFARKLLVETDLGIAEIAFHAGFGSVRSFNEAVRAAYAVTPTSLRKKRVSAATGEITLRLNYRPPMDWASTLAFMTPRLLPGIEIVRDGHWRRAVTFDDHEFLVDVTADPRRPQLLVRIDSPPPGSLATLVRRVRHVFDLDADLDAVARVLSADPLLAPSLAMRPGMRVPGAWDLFEVLVRAIVGQQVSVAAATTVAGRVIDRFGHHPEHLPGFTVFPTPESLADAPLESCGINRARAEAVRTISRAVLDGRIKLDSPGTPAEFEAALVALPGIGPWTARYVCMRGLGEPDAFPDSDLGLIRAMERAGLPAAPKDLARRAEAWRPWRAYAALHLWATLGDGLSPAGKATLPKRKAKGGATTARKKS